MAVVVVETRPFTVHIDSIRYVDGEKFFGTCSCGWQSIILQPRHALVKDELKQHMLTAHPVENREIGTRLLR